MRLLVISLFFLPLLFISGCSTPAIILDIRADDTLNQDREGYSYSVLVRMYQLDSPENFAKADYQLLLDGNSSALGKSLLSQEEFIVEPGQVYSLRFRREKGAEYKGLVAYFRHVEGEQWRVFKQMDKGLASDLTSQSEVRLSGNRLYIIGNNTE